jgi:hypothetical protein
MDENVECKNDLIIAKTKLFMAISTFLVLLTKLLFFCVGGYIAYYITVLSLPPFLFSGKSGLDDQAFFIFRVVFYIFTFIVAWRSGAGVERAFHFLKTKK